MEETAIAEHTSVDTKRVEAFFEACKTGDFEYVKNELSLACIVRDTKDLTAHPGVKVTGLHLAAWRGQTRIVELLLTKCPVDVLDGEGSTALTYAASSGAIKCMRLLLDAGADIMHCNEAGYTVHSIISYTDYDMCYPIELIYWKHATSEEGQTIFGCTANQCGIYLYYIDSTPELHDIARELLFGVKAKPTGDPDFVPDDPEAYQFVPPIPEVEDVSSKTLVSDAILIDTPHAFHNLARVCRNPFSGLHRALGFPTELVTLIIQYLGDMGTPVGTGDAPLDSRIYAKPLLHSEKMLWAMMSECQKIAPKEPVQRSKGWTDIRYAVSARLALYKRLLWVLETGWTPETNVSS